MPHRNPMENTMRILPALMMTLCLAAPDALRAAGDGPVVEIVTFRLLPGAAKADFLTAAAGTEAPLRKMPGFVARRLVQAPDGTWTDLVEWASLSQAHAAADAMMAEPAFAPFMALIDGATVAMRHDHILWRMD
jgi:hypothetical protein